MFLCTFWNHGLILDSEMFEIRHVWNHKIKKKTVTEQTVEEIQAEKLVTKILEVETVKEVKVEPKIEVEIIKTETPKIEIVQNTKTIESEIVTETPKIEVEIKTQKLEIVQNEVKIEENFEVVKSADAVVAEGPAKIWAILQV